MRIFNLGRRWPCRRERGGRPRAAVFRYKIYAPLRDDETLFRTVRVSDDGFAVAWDRQDLDMAPTTVADLAEQVMMPARFGAFVKRNGYTLDGVAAELGISRRLAAYYASERAIPRYIALACHHLDRAATADRTTLLGKTHPAPRLARSELEADCRPACPTKASSQRRSLW